MSNIVSVQRHKMYPKMIYVTVVIILLKHVNVLLDVTKVLSEKEFRKNLYAYRNASNCNTL